MINGNVFLIDAEYLFEGFYISGIIADDFNYLIMIGQATFDRVNGRLFRLAFQIRFASIPELCFHVGGIDYRGRIAGAEQAVVSFGNGTMIGKGFSSA